MRTVFKTGIRAKYVVKVFIVIIIIIISDYAHAGVQCFLVESYSLLLKNIFLSFLFLSFFLPFCKLNDTHKKNLTMTINTDASNLQPAPIAQSVECPLRRTGHTKVVKNGTSCSSLGTQIYGIELGLVDPVSG